VLPVLARLILGILLLMGMGMAQVIGVSRGYLCFCAPEPKLVVESVCDPASCHDAEAGHYDRSVVVAAADDDHDHSSVPEEGEHRHEEVREVLKTTGVAAAQALPPPVCQEVSASLFRVFAFDREGPGVVHFAKRGWKRDGSPPAALLVARVMVRLV
jgi:hypothetical protein